jgi:hypothetical protein
MSETANRWFTRHRYVSEEKIVTLVLHKSGQVIDNPDGTFTLIANMIHNGRSLALYIKAIENPSPNYIEMRVIKIHSGFLRDLKFLNKCNQSIDFLMLWDEFTSTYWLSGLSSWSSMARAPSSGRSSTRSKPSTLIQGRSRPRAAACP